MGKNVSEGNDVQNMDAPSLIRNKTMNYLNKSLIRRTTNSEKFSSTSYSWKYRFIERVYLTMQIFNVLRCLV